MRRRTESRQPNKCLGPGNSHPGTRDYLFVPSPFGSLEIDELEERGLYFERSDFGEDQERIRDFVESGIISTSRCVVVIFCDLKGSTAALRLLGSDFRFLQNAFFDACTSAIGRSRDREMAVLKSDPVSRERFVIDKFMGDGAMLYGDFGDATTGEAPGRLALAAKPTLQLVQHIIDQMENPRLGEKTVQILDRLESNSVTLGVRFGIAAGTHVTMSVLGGSKSSTYGDFTLTGEPVNLAARLEHATPAEFLSELSHQTARLSPYTSRIGSVDSLRGSTLGHDLCEIDRQAIDIYDVCRCNFEIRSDTSFYKCVEANDVRLAWKKIPFSPRGFSGTHNAYLLGGRSSDELLRIV